MEPMIVTDLERKRCTRCPDAHAMRLDPLCHPGAPVRVFYDNEELTIRCAVCEQTASKVAVARAN